MALTTAYLVTTKNLEAFLNALVSAKAPERFTNKFLKDLEFASSNDRLFIRLLKGLEFLDESGVPQSRYYEYLDQSQSGKVLAAAIREAYADLFAIKKSAQKLSTEEVKNKLKTLTQGQKSDNVLNWMANTFTALCSLAEWTRQDQVRETLDEAPITAQDELEEERTDKNGTPRRKPSAELHYSIQIHLPESRDPAVFDAIFRALRKHIL